MYCLMTISDFLQKYKIVIMYLNFWPIFLIYLYACVCVCVFYIAPILHLSPCLWGTLHVPDYIDQQWQTLKTGLMMLKIQL